MTGFFYIMNMMKKMNAIEIASYINNEVGMDIASADEINNVTIRARHDFLGNEIYFDNSLFFCDSIYSYINQQGFDSNDMPYFCTNSFVVETCAEARFECFNPEGAHERKCKFDAVTGIREFDMETLKNSVDGLKKALKVLESSKLKIADEIEFMDI